MHQRIRNMNKAAAAKPPAFNNARIHTYLFNCWTSFKKTFLVFSSKSDQGYMTHTLSLWVLHIFYARWQWMTDNKQTLYECIISHNNKSIASTDKMTAITQKMVTVSNWLIATNHLQHLFPNHKSSELSSAKACSRIRLDNGHKRAVPAVKYNNDNDNSRNIYIVLWGQEMQKCCKYLNTLQLISHNKRN